MILSCLKYVLAYIVAFSFSSVLGGWLKKQFFMEKAKEMIEDKVADFLGMENATGADIATLIDSEHSGFFSFLEKMGVDVNTINDVYRNADGTINEAVSEYIAEPCVSALSSVLAFVILFVVTLLLVLLVELILNQVAKLPGIKGTNKVLGGILGFIFGIFWAFVASALIRIIIPFFSDNAVVSSLNEGATLYNFFTSIAPSFLTSIL